MLALPMIGGLFFIGWLLYDPSRESAPPSATPAPELSYTPNTEPPIYSTEYGSEFFPPNSEPLTPAPDIPVPGSESRTPNAELLRFREEYKNDDIIGHLIIPGTDIDYLVVQAGDNVFYLDRDLHKQHDRAGTIFLDHENRLTRPDRNTILYGHNMVAAGTHFATLTRFRDENFFRENRFILFDTIYEDTVWEIFAFYSTDVSFQYIQVIFPGADSFGRLLSDIMELSWHDAGLDITTEDRIITLSTCTTMARNMRYVLHARLIQ